MSAPTFVGRLPFVQYLSCVRSSAVVRPAGRGVRLPATREAASLVGAMAAVGVVSWAHVRWLDVPDPTIGALSYLIVVIVAAAASTFRVAAAASVAAAVCFNYFFLDPVGTFAIAGRQDWFALLTLVVASGVVSRLSAEARARMAEATARGDALECALAVTRGLVEEQRQTETARRSAVLKSTLLASLGHGLRTPLAALAVAADNLAAPGIDAAEREAQVALIRAEVVRLRRLFDKLADMARVESDAVTIHPQWAEPEAIVADAVQQIDSVADGRRVACRSDGQLAAARLDPRLTRDALSHVIENAVQYSPPGSVIDVEVGVRAGRLSIGVRDRGPGVGLSELPHLFEPGYRGRAAAPGGTGMGLAIARGLILAQGGDVRAGNHPGGGAIVTLTVPVDVRAAKVADEEDDR